MAVMIDRPTYHDKRNAAAKKKVDEAKRVEKGKAAEVEHRT